MQKDSRQLVEDASRGDAPAVESLLDRFLPGLLLYVRRRAGPTVLDKESSSDLVQSVCRELFENLRTERFEYRGEAEFKQWLYGAALLKLEGRRRHWRAEKRDAGREAAPFVVGGSDGSSVPIDPTESGTPSADAIRREDAERLSAAVASLPEKYRQIIDLAYGQCLSHAEIAERMAISETNSRVLLSRALARLGTIGARL
jgi:RNA polymerase sigma factor (sigma-70 family)